MAWGHGNLGGGAAGFPVGMILVDYPSNSILTIAGANGGKYSKNDISSTRRMYYIKDPDTYTISSTEKTTGDSTSKIVNVERLGQSNYLELKYGLILIDGTYINKELTGEWYKYSMKFASSWTERDVSVSSTNPYLVLTQGSESSSSGGSGIYTNFASAASVTLVDLTEFNKLVMVYDLEAVGTVTTTARKVYATLLAQDGTTWWKSNYYQSTSKYKANTDTQSADFVSVNTGEPKLVDQIMELDISAATGPVFIGIGLNATQNKSQGILTVKRLYATN